MTWTRRRFLTITAAAMAAPSVALSGGDAQWNGHAMGARARMTLSGVSALEARPVFAAIETELDRLERIFSLYRSDSALGRLNRTGRLQAVPADLREVLRICGALHDATGGAFDPTVQPMWEALARHGTVAEARARIGWHRVQREGTGLRLSEPGMALTLNGIAQGYMTDRIAALLRARGYRDILVDMGEVAGFGRSPEGGAWQAGIGQANGEIVRRVTLKDRALATSSPMGTVLDASGRQGHILDPRGNGGPVHDTASVSAPRAAVADGLSTALCLLSRREARQAVACFSGARIEFLG